MRFLNLANPEGNNQRVQIDQSDLRDLSQSNHSNPLQIHSNMQSKVHAYSPSENVADTINRKWYITVFISLGQTKKAAIRLRLSDCTTKAQETKETEWLVRFIFKMIKLTFFILRLNHLFLDNNLLWFEIKNTRWKLKTKI